MPTVLGVTTATTKRQSPRWRATGLQSVATTRLCELEDGPSIPAETARRLACDASIVSIVENERGDPLNVSYKNRSIPPARRRALNARDQGCRFPGCANKRFVDAHHVHHWARGGETNASNLVTLCRFHHRKVHEGGVVIQILDDGAFRFAKPNGESFDSIAPNHTQPLGDWQQLPVVHHEHGVHIDKNTAATRWSGEQRIGQQSSYCCPYLTDVSRSRGWKRTFETAATACFRRASCFECVVLEAMVMLP